MSVDPLKNVKELIPYVPGKPVEELERELGVRNAVKLASNENPLGPSPRAMEAVKNSLPVCNRYPDGGCFYLKGKLAEKLGVSPENLIIGNGSNEVIQIAARTYMNHEHEAIFGGHAFIVYPLVTKAVGAKEIVSPMPDMKNDLQDIASRVTDKTRMIFLANPNNPTGTIFKKNEFEWFLDNVPEDVIILVDEAYFEYVDEVDYPDTLKYHEKRESLITVRTFSKIYGLAGLRVGYAIASGEIISYLNRVREPFNVSTLAQSAALAAIDDEEHIEKSRLVNSDGMAYLCRELDRMGISHVPSFANFVLVDMKTDPLPYYQSLLEKGVIVRPVGGYGLKEHLRVSVGLADENERFVKALGEVIDEIQ